MKLLLLALMTQPLWAYEIQNIKVSGDKEAFIHFEGLPADAVPSLKVNGNTIDISFQGANLNAKLEGKVDLESPHALIQRVSVYEATKQNVRSKIVLNGTTDDLANRVKFDESSGALKLKIAFPKGDHPALNLLQEEQKPVLTAPTVQKKEKPLISTAQIFMVVMVILLAGACSFFAVRFLKNKGSLRGTRKFLLEQLGYVSLGNKIGVSLIKVGNEFVLVGVTPGQVSLLSTLPKLEQKYAEESQFERGVFKEAFEEEYQRLKRSDANA